MSLFESIVLGIVQGFTEFLPVSSSGHLVIAQNLLPGFSHPGILLEAILHAGTMFAIIVFFRREILTLDRRMILLLLLGSVPAGFVGLFFRDFLTGLFENLRLVGFALLGTGVMNWVVGRPSLKLRTASRQISVIDSLIIGVFQAIAIVPGISRSGATIFAGVFRGIPRRQVAAFSFLLSIPAVSGAVFLQLLDNGGGSLEVMPYIVGFLAAFGSGYVAIKIVMTMLLKEKFRVFAIYCFLLGLTTIALAA